MSETKHLFVVGLDDFNLGYLRKVRHAEHYVFHGLLDYREVVRPKRFDMPRLLEKAERTLREFEGTVDAVVGYWDFPTQLMLPILRRGLGLPGPTLESVLRCEHKYWSRLEQREAAPGHVPRFSLVDPFSPDAAERIDLPFPFWIKPVKAHSSMLGFVVHDAPELERALTRIREGIWYLAEPFNHILEHAELPEHIAGVRGECCIAEEIIAYERQCTLEGYVYAGRPYVYGVVDSIRGPNGSSFERYEYPSTLPEDVQSRMKDLACAVIERTGLDGAPFNMEFYYDPAGDRIRLLEINARISKSHAPLFERVEGTPHHEVMIDLALGRRPEYPLREGEARVAAKFMLRRYGEHDDEVVRGVPSEAALHEIEQRFPSTRIRLNVSEGMPLGEMRVRDSYSYELADIFTAADDEAELLAHYRECVKALDLQFEPA